MKWFLSRKLITFHQRLYHVFKTLQLLLAVFEFVFKIVTTIIAAMNFVLFGCWIMAKIHLILEWMISLSSSSWSNFFIRLVSIASFLVVLGICRDMQEVNDYRVYLWSLASLNMETTVAVEMLSRLVGMDMRMVFLELLEQLCFRESLRSRVGRFSLLETLD